MPTITGISHLSLSARDAAASAGWYRDVLGFEIVDHIDGDGWTCVLLRHDETGTTVEFQQHEDNRGETFDPTRTGLDHLALAVPARADLDAWQQRLAAHGVTHTPVAERDYGSVLCFRDPDGIQLELFHQG